MSILVDTVRPTTAIPPSGESVSARATQPKILLYSHDTFGLGNIRRTLLIAEALADEFPEAAILIVTGSPVIHAFRIPKGVDYIKLPCLDRVDADRYEPRFLQEWADEIQKMRQAVLKKSVLGFNPDLIIVDKRPGGISGELKDTLQTLRRQNRATKVVVGIRDILDDPISTQRSMKRSRDFEYIDRYYDQVWIYGIQSIFNPIDAYHFPESVAQKTHFCGYLQRPTVDLITNDGPPRVLVTTGGGGDGSRLIETYLQGLLDLPRRVMLRSTIMFGPQMPTERRNALLAQYGHLSDVAFRDFEPDLTQRYAEADLVISMAGYNTVCELLSFQKRAILVPRAKPVQEQLIRARIFAELGYFDMVDPDFLTPDDLMNKVLTSLNKADDAQPHINLGGLPEIRQQTRQLLAQAVAAKAANYA